ncbi:HipA domain-containing protein [uncultured Brevundimonas sp.]|uniref:type II toxin-antitoxin system HipA family toxin n=1 Tax=uncultured Brevundimonas sp. TaxID=213418 RepID=UPI00261E497A|nr:HipA domain-containing protein [uncultured Brevundimonas sp.]
MAADILEVLLAGRPIGALTALNGDRSIFSFNDAYAEDEARPTLSLSFKDAHGRLIRDFNHQQTRLLPFFSNLLPEGPLRDYLAKRANVKIIREYPLLEVLGLDLPGAVTVRSAGEGAIDDGAPPEAVQAKPGKGPLRFSLAGVQLKFSAVEKAHGGLTIPASGAGGDWIVKLPSTRFAGVSENEFSMMKLADAMGMDVPEVRLMPLDEIEGLPEGIGRIEEGAFAIRRFDRTEDGGLVHIEDFAQVFGVYPEDKYGKGAYRSIARVLWIETGEAGVREFIARLVFNTLIGNADMHLKNWSLIYPDGRAPQIAPAYDFLSTTVYIPDDSMALRFGRSRLMTDLSIDEMTYMAAKAGLPETLVRRAALGAVERFRDVWPRERPNLPVSKDVAAEIERLLAAVPIANGR